ncbi:MAG: 30S ribosomal protein S1 [Alphaproteobacteria bacterium]|nr:30S ribosomal protein S1 [Alphaproteobacteria bacterium]OJV47813.1 MAG: 30S ribosomal protein S1 [Alphaproteobacteria bacterium 43-37]
MVTSTPSTNKIESQSSSMESFAALLEESFGSRKSLEGEVVKGRVVGLEGDSALVDVGLKSEGRILLKEFGSAALKADIKVGDLVDVYVERFEDKNGEVVLSREKAIREATWVQLEESHRKAEKVTGVIFGRVKGGFSVDLMGVVAFLPGSQVDIRPIRDASPLIGMPQPFQILKMDRARGNIVVSRRAVLEETRAEARTDLVQNLSEGQVLTGVVKNITDYGAFVDLGGVDGLLHVTDISWRRVNHPSEVISIGQNVKVQVIRFNKDTQRISLGMKQLELDPWADVENRYPIGNRLKGRITNITDYGAFVELDDGIEGLVHVSEMSWTKKNVHPGKIVSTSQEVEVIVLDVDSSKRRISLGLKQCHENPWKAFATQHNVGDIIEGEVRNATEFGLFIGLNDEIDGMIHLNDLSWEKSGEEALQAFKKGDMLKAKLLDIDVEKERIALGIKQLQNDPFESAMSDVKKGSVVTCTITEITDGGLEVKLAGDVIGFIKKADLSRERSEQRPERFAVGEQLDAKVITIERGSRKVNLSVKAKEIDDDKQAVADFGSSDSGASLGDILGAAIFKAKQKDAEKSEE